MEAREEKRERKKESEEQPRLKKRGKNRVSGVEETTKKKGDLSMSICSLERELYEQSRLLQSKVHSVLTPVWFAMTREERCL